MNNKRIKLQVFVIILCVIALSGHLFDNYTYADTENTIENSNTELHINDFFRFNQTKLTYEELPLEQFTSKDLSLQIIENKPQILIFHSHSQESYIDSDPNDVSTTVVGIGRELKKQLEKNYDIHVFHCEDKFDVVDGKINRINSYDRLEPVIKNILKENPSIEVLIDIQRDGVAPSQNEVVMINTKPSSKVFFVNGISRKIVDGKSIDIEDLPNPYVKENLNFSFQMKLKADKNHPCFMEKISVSPYRYSLHMAPKSLLVYFGNNQNTFEEARNSVEPFAEILADVLGLKKSNTSK